MLAADETEAVTQFEKELLKAGGQTVFEFSLFDSAVKPEEFQVVRALEHLVRLFGKMFREGEFEIAGLLLLHGPLVRAGFDLVKQDAAGPAKLGGRGEVLEAGGGVGNAGQRIGMVSPGYLGHQFSHKV